MPASLQQKGQLPTAIYSDKPPHWQLTVDFQHPHVLMTLDAQSCPKTRPSDFFFLFVDGAEI
jgi:hypothetical protein